MASKKLTPGNSKSGAGGRKTSTRRTGRTTGISQSAFAGYAFKGNQPAAQPPAEPAAESPVEDESVDDVSCAETVKPDAKESQDSKD